MVLESPITQEIKIFFNMYKNSDVNITLHLLSITRTEFRAFRLVYKFESTIENLCK